MKKEIRIFIEDISKSIEKIEEYTYGMSKEGFFRASQVQDAVIRRLEMIGEAATTVHICKKENKRKTDGLQRKNPKECQTGKRILKHGYLMRSEREIEV